MARGGAAWFTSQSLRDEEDALCLGQRLGAPRIYQSDKTSQDDAVGDVLEPRWAARRRRSVDSLLQSSN